MDRWKKIILSIAGFLTLLAGGAGVNNYLGGRTVEVTHTLLSATSSAGWSSAFPVDGYKNISILASAFSSPTMTIKFAISNSDSAPTFSSSQSATNHWDYVEITDLEDGTLIDGDDGWVLTGTNDFRNFKLNTEMATWFAVQISTSTVGTTTIKVKYATND